MALIPLNIPAGVYRNGTDYQSSGRWLDVNLIRFSDNTVQPVGGWAARTDTAANATIRAMHAWRDNSANQQVAAATYNKLYAYNAGGVQYDITPVGLTAGSEYPVTNAAYGGGLYGVDTYGTARTETGVPDEATTWTLDNWGEYLIACSYDDGNIYEWQLNTGTPAATIANAPTGCLGAITTYERFLFALGAGGNPRKVQWSDREDNTTWTPSATNEAGDIELETAGEIQCAVKVRGQTLIITSTDAHTATYQGPPFVYGFERVGTSCGIIGRKAAASIDLGAFWMGRDGFYTYSGGNVQELASEVEDYVFRDMNRTAVSQIFAVPNGRFAEIWWFYPSSGSAENDRYVVYNYKENTWSIGQLARTAGVDSGVFSRPIWANPSDQLLYDHEKDFGYGGLTPYAETAPISIGQGDQVMVVTEMIPDELTQGDVTATFKTRFHPNDTERTYGSYTMSNPTSVRFTGRQIRMLVTGATNTDWRVGTMRLEAVGGGRR